MMTGTVTALDTDTASYERLSWTEKGDGLTVLKGQEDRAYTDKIYSVVGFTGFSGGEPKKSVFDPSKDKSFPQGLTISGNRAAVWTTDRRACLRHPRAAQADDASAGGQARRRQRKARKHRRRPRRRRRNRRGREGRPRALALEGRAAPVAAASPGRRRPQLQLPLDVPRRPQKFVRLADDELRTVTWRRSRSTRSASTIASTS